MSKNADKNDRITARLPSHTKKTIEEGANIIGATMNQFIVQAALEKAEKLVEKSRTLSFSEDEAKNIMIIMASEYKPNIALKKASKLHSELLD